MKRILYIDCFSGVAGDMMLGALLDLGVPLAHVEAGLAALGDIGHYHLRVDRAARHGIVGTDVHVDSHQHAHGHAHEHEHAHGHAHEHEHAHGHEQHGHEQHGHEPHEHEHAHGRTWQEIQALIAGSGMTTGARELALRIFGRLAVAEGRVHGIDPEHVHFHEVGAIDAIVDICGTAIALDWLAVDVVVSAPLPMGRGFVRCAHGMLPLPGPATLELCRDARVKAEETRDELVTPTGAAIVTTLVSTAAGYRSLPDMVIERVGYGVGDRDSPDRPNLLRLVLGSAEAEHGDEVVVEANIDDLPAELLAHACERVLALGAHDVWCTPIVMKKGRAGVMVSVLCGAGQRATVEATLLRETSTLGLRWHAVARTRLERRWKTASTPWGTVRVKEALDGATVVNRAPEFEECRALALAAGVPLKDVYAAALAATA